jgi:carbon-monoxide dehydrogenase large subunit
MLGYQDFRAQQEQARTAGRYIGVGIGSYIEGTAPSSAVMQSSGVSVIGGDEGVAIRVETDGIVTVLTGTCSHGQGHATTFAQMTADELGVPLTAIKVVQGDTAIVPEGWGTWGSRSAVVSGGAIAIAAKELRGDILEAASRLSEIPTDDLELVDGIILRKQDSRQVVTLTELAKSVPVQLEAATRYEPPALTHSNASHVVTVEVDIETGQVKLLRYIVVEDCGTMLNPLIVEGQIQGGVAQGIGMALYEHAIYDENGQFLTGTLMDYLIPTAADVPEVEIGHLESPSPYVASGIKGMGEGGAIAPPAAIANAVADALRPFGVQVNTVPITPEQVLTMLDRAQANTNSE